MTNYFELYDLPVSFHPDQAAVKSKFYELSRLHHPDHFAQTGGTGAADALNMSSVNNAAYKTLKDSDATMAYILKLDGLLEDEEKYALPPAFLMEMMDINEAISEYEMDPANESVIVSAVKLLNEQLGLWNDATNILMQRFDSGEKEKELLLQIKDQYFRKKYLLRIKERIDRFATRL